MDYTDRASIVEDFWLAVARNDNEEATAAVLRLEAPPVGVSSSYSYEIVEGEELEDRGAEGQERG